MSHRPLLTGKVYIHSLGFFRTVLWQTEDGQWHFDGPASNGPKRIRKGGAFWRGNVTPGEARSILRAMRKVESHK